MGLEAWLLETLAIIQHLKWKRRLFPVLQGLHFRYRATQTSDGLEEISAFRFRESYFSPWHSDDTPGCFTANNDTAVHQAEMYVEGNTI
jgi:hypothetical protein